MLSRSIARHRLMAELVGFLPLIIFLALLTYVGVNAPNFMTLFNLKLVLMQSLPVVLLVTGLSAVVMAGGDDVVSGGIDLSIPATAVLCAGITAVLLASGLSLLAASLAALAAALAAGAVNAVLITRLRMTPLLTTLAMFVALVGINNMVTSRRRINLTDGHIGLLREDFVFGIPLGIVIVAFVVLVAYHLLHRTRWGLNLQAAGGSRAQSGKGGVL